MARAERRLGADAEARVEDGDGQAALDAVADDAALGGERAREALAAVGALVERDGGAVPHVDTGAEAAEVVRSAADTHDAAEGLDADGEGVGETADAERGLAVDEAHVADGGEVLLVAAEADVEQGAVFEALEVAVADEVVLLLLELDRQREADDAGLDVVEGGELEQGVGAGGGEEAEAVQAGDAGRAHGVGERRLVGPGVALTLADVLEVLHAAAGAVAALDGGLGLGLEAREVEVLLERADAEVVDNVAHEAGHARVVVGGVDEPAHEADLEGHVAVGEDDEVLDEREAEEVQVRRQEDVEIHGGTAREQRVEEGHELAAGRPHGHLGDAVGAAEGEVLDGGEHVVHVLERDELEWRELEAVVLDEGHAVAVHAEKDLRRGAAQEYAAHDVADVEDVAAPGEVRGLDEREEDGLQREREKRAEEHGVEALELGGERGAGLLLLGEEQ
ncbi:MAG: hypothetical protein EBR09_16755, partial [Proteobacteria bacterium]|nr:hypothetical protein [Pseudomonadota bacterium]